MIYSQHRFIEELKRMVTILLKKPQKTRSPVKLPFSSKPNKNKGKEKELEFILSGGVGGEEEAEDEQQKSTSEESSKSEQEKTLM